MKFTLLDELNYMLFKKTRLIKKVLLIIVLSVVSTSYLKATDYYFSSSTGDDNRSATQAQNSSTPWRSIDKLNAFADQLKAGDRILFKSGDTFYGTILISRGGSSGNPITYTSYGTGAKPVITSMLRVSNWVSRGNGTYEASLSNMDAGNVQILAVNNQIREVGRYPNTGTANEGFLTVTSVNNSLSIQGANMPANFVGGEIVIRKNDWITDRHEISYNAGSTISFLSNPETGYTPKSGFGYFVQNHLNTLDQFGEWAYSKSNKRIYGYFGGQNPNSLNVQVATRDYLVKTNRYIQNLTFNNLNLTGANADLFNIQNSANVQITNCELNFAGQNGIYSHTTPDLIIRSNTFNYSLSGGIFLPFGTPRVIIQDNVVSNTMPFQGMANSSDLKGVAIYIAGDANNSQVTRNRVLNTGFNGIHFGGNYTVIKNNLIDNYCLFKHDGGGIYTNSDGITWGNNEGREIVGNIIRRGKGAIAGTPVKDELAEGIYIDDNANGIKISDNTISEVTGKGLYLHNAKNLEVLNNTFYNIPIQLHVGDDVMGNPVRNVRVEGNQFSRVYEEEVPYSISSDANDINQIGTSNNNYFLDPYGVEVLFKSQSPNDGPGGRKWNMPNWANQYGYERNSLRPDFDLEKYTVISANTIKESDFSSNLNIVSAVYNGSSELSTGIDGGVWKINFNQTTNASAFIQIGAVSQGDEILVEFDTKSSTANQTVGLLLEKTFNQNQEGTVFDFVTSTETKKVKLLLKANVSAGNESVVFKFPKTLPNILIDNLKISKVQTDPINVEQQVFFQYNYSNQTVSYPLSGVYKNGKGQIFNGSVSIPAYSSALLAKIEEGAAQENLPPTVSLSQPTQNQVFNIGSPVLITANASDPEGQIQRVEFYVNDNLVGSSTQAPFQFSWNNAPVGNFRIKAKVIDQGSLSAESAVINVSVVDPNSNNQPPVTSIVTPTQNQIFDEGNAVLIQAYVADPENQIAKVEFFNGNILIGSVTGPPYQINWTNAPAGNHSLKTRVTDQGGLSAESGVVNITVNSSGPANQPPVTSIVTPTQNQSFDEGDPVLIQAYVADPENKIAKVEFFNGNTLIGTVTGSPYQINWNNAPAGNHSLKTRVTDQGGLSAESGVVNITVNSTGPANQPPVTSIVTPTQNQSFDEGKAILIQAYVADPENQIARVEFFNGNTLIGTVTRAPFEINWTNAPVGNHSLKTRVTDQGGLLAESGVVNITVNSSAPANQPPVTSIVTPTQNQSFDAGKTILIQAYVADPENQIARVEFFRGNTLIGTVTRAPFEINWTNAPVGNHSLKTRVTDQGGLSTESGVVNINVKSSTPANQAPFTSIVTPSNNQSFAQGSDILIQSYVSDPENQIALLEFFSGNTLIGSVTSSPYQLLVRNVPAGNYVIKTRVTDQGGLSAESDLVNVTVYSGSGFRTNNLEIVSPSMDQKFKSSENVTVEVGNQSANTKYDSLEVYVRGIKVGSTKEFSFDLPGNTVSEGDNVITVKAFQYGAELSSDWVNVAILKDQIDSQNNSFESFGEDNYTFDFGPNPTSDILNIYLDKMYQDEEVEIHIYNVNGTTLDVLQTNTNVGKLTIDVSSYSQGVYFIRILGKVFIYDTKRFIKN
ncbi:Ig-like domain-containing protein [Algoriphagus sp.]|uniref:Ig-like domain-containing protein n=1 Tax=Algoriphagus sp. TaxID=1872435 RepID=UPI0025D9D4F2|nr:Ig-like domain-containing protein [Algoriphagus sp.]